MATVYIRTESGTQILLTKKHDVYVAPEGESGWALMLRLEPAVSERPHRRSRSGKTTREIPEPEFHELASFEDVNQANAALTHVKKTIARQAGWDASDYKNSISTQTQI